MAKDADGNYYYDEGTLAEQLDDWEVYEDDDGNVGFYNAVQDTELRLHQAGHVFGDTRDDPDSTELADGETMLYVANADSAATEGALVVATSDGTDVTVEEVDSTAPA